MAPSNRCISICSLVSYVCESVYRVNFSVVIVQKRGQPWQTAGSHASEETQKIENHSVGSRFVCPFMAFVQFFYFQFLTQFLCILIVEHSKECLVNLSGLITLFYFYSSGMTCDIVPNYVIKSLPTMRVRKESRLLYPGVQCRICLSRFQLGQHVRTLPCKHKVTHYQVQLTQCRLNADKSSFT